MSPRVAILTPDPAGMSYGTRWPEVLERMLSPLRADGMNAEGRSWTDPAGLQGFDLILPLLVWGYHRDRDWQGQVGEWERQGLPLQNPASVLRWNADKIYLQRLAQAGAPVVPTRFVDVVDEQALQDAAEEFGADRLVAKPRISSTAFQTIRWSPGDSLEGAPDRAAMIQPYLPAIEDAGEVSLIYLGSAFSHAIVKRPQPGDFRVQPEFDGVITPHAPARDEFEAAKAILAAVEEPLLYARIDLVRDLAGKPALIELELVEPDLYLGHDPAAPGRFAEAVRSAAG